MRERPRANAILIILKAMLLTVATIATAPLACGQGGPPMISDDPDTPGNGKWENNIALMVATSDAGQILETPNVDLNYGFGDKIQLNYQAGLISQRLPGEPNDAGLTQHVIGVKYRFVDAGTEKVGMSLSTYPKFAFKGPLSSPNSSLTPTEAQWQLPLQLKFRLGDVAVTTEVGRTFANTKPSGWIYGSVLGASLREGVDVMLELHGDYATTTRQDDWLVNIGTRLAVCEDVDVIAALGRFVKPSGRGPEGVVYAGITLHQ